MEKLNVMEYIENEYNQLMNLAIYTRRKNTLHIIQVGNEEASNKYINNKIKKCNMLNIPVIHHKINSYFDKHYIKEQIELIIKNLTDRDKVIVQEPTHTEWINDIDIKKDVDGTSIYSKKCRSIGKKSYIPCTARGIVDYMEYIDLNLKGKSVLIINRSDLVGNPLKDLLLDRNMLVTVAHSHITKEKLLSIMDNYDYVISGIGQPHYFKSSEFPDGITFIDVGISFKDGKMVGDLLVEDNCITNSKYTPVPNGVGQLTVLSLMKNILDS